jgi:hypothetical protein
MGFLARLVPFVDVALLLDGLGRPSSANDLLEIASAIA